MIGLLRECIDTIGLAVILQNCLDREIYVDTFLYEIFDGLA